MRLTYMETKSFCDTNKLVRFFNFEMRDSFAVQNLRKLLLTKILFGLICSYLSLYAQNTQPYFCLMRIIKLAPLRSKISILVQERRQNWKKRNLDWKKIFFRNWLKRINFFPDSETNYFLEKFKTVTKFRNPIFKPEKVFSKGKNCLTSCQPLV